MAASADSVREDLELLDIPDAFICAITQEVMQDPVIAADGHTYEREAITMWLRGHRTSPRTNVNLPHITLTPNIALRQAIEAYIGNMPEIQRREIQMHREAADLQAIIQLREAEMTTKLTRSEQEKEQLLRRNRQLEERLVISSREREQLVVEVGQLKERLQIAEAKLEASEAERTHVREALQAARVIREVLPRIEQLGITLARGSDSSPVSAQDASSSLGAAAAASYPQRVISESIPQPQPYTPLAAASAAPRVVSRDDGEAAAAAAPAADSSPPVVVPERFDDTLLQRIRNNDKTLVLLNLNNKKIGAAGAASLSAALKQNGTLTALGLSWNNLGAAGAASLSEALKQNGTLTELDLGGNALGAAGAASLSEALKQNGTLTTLSLRNNNLGAAGAASLAEALKQNHTLTTLNLDGNNLGAAGAASLSEALKQNGTLTELDLRYNNLGAAGAASLSEALKQNRTLTTLNLMYNAIGAAGAASLASALMKNHTLTTLEIGEIPGANVSQLTKYIERNRILVANLITAIRTGDAKSIATINELIQQGTSINQILERWSPDKGSSPMMIACKEGNIATIQTLLPHWNHNDIKHKKAILEIVIKRNDRAIMQLFRDFAEQKNDQDILQLLSQDVEIHQANAAAARTRPR